MKQKALASRRPFDTEHLGHQLHEALEAKRHAAGNDDIVRELLKRAEATPLETREAVASDMIVNLRSRVCPCGDSECSLGYGTCNACFTPLNASWYKCKVCPDYDECDSCYNAKAKAGTVHPHPFARWEWGILGKDRAELGSTNILCFDGGGVRGVSSIIMLHELFARLFELQDKEDDFDRFCARLVREKFDCITGTSIGGIIALLLAMGMPLRLLRWAFGQKSTADMVFRRAPWYNVGSATFEVQGIRELFALLLNKWRSMSDDSNLFAENIYTDGEIDIDKIKMRHVTVQRCGVTCFDMVSKSALFISTFHNVDGCSFQNLPVIDAMLATAAAPTYFPIHRFEHGRTFACVDGGVFANNPSLQALLVARVLNGASRQDWRYNILNIGTGLPHLNPKTADSSSWSGMWENAIGWVVGWDKRKRIVDAMFDASASSTLRTMSQLQLTNRLTHVVANVRLTKEIDLSDTGSIMLQEQLVLSGFDSYLSLRHLDDPAKHTKTWTSVVEEKNRLHAAAIANLGARWQSLRAKAKSESQEIKQLWSKLELDSDNFVVANVLAFLVRRLEWSEQQSKEWRDNSGLGPVQNRFSLPNPALSSYLRLLGEDDSAMFSLARDLWLHQQSQKDILVDAVQFMFIA